jgi:hypothetical protein
MENYCSIRVYWEICDDACTVAALTVESRKVCDNAIAYDRVPRDISVPNLFTTMR